MTGGLVAMMGNRIMNSLSLILAAAALGIGVAIADRVSEAPVNTAQPTVHMMPVSLPSVLTR
ncbi:hypothetical protein APE01nite_13050 [Acetobacter peroxydans]|uniref:Uncharacterized protein n=1 Tax=Acetobacter peroxydans TaxID=104098 RepID=A0A4Y3TUX5_9PROT|nr:hypothetical protein APE01nite_13050 [Acetobacter peroxydans]